MTTDTNATTEACARGYTIYKALARQAGFGLGCLVPPGRIKRERLNERLVAEGHPPVSSHTFHSYRQQLHANRVDYVPVNQHSYGLAHGPTVNVGELMVPAP